LKFGEMFGSAMWCLPLMSEILWVLSLEYLLPYFICSFLKES
jgi:hypothetical protein